MSRPAPDVGPEAAAFWAATRAHRLVVQHCPHCDTLQHFPRAFCATCLADDLDVVAVSGRGTVYAHTVVRRPPGPAFAAAGMTPADVDLVSVYDCYTITVILTLEDAGFCAKGDGGPFVADHDLTFGGDLPCNTHGGQLSYGQAGLAGGASHVTEAVVQLRGEAGDRQVADCGLAFVNGNGGVLAEQCSLVLERGDW